MLTSRDRIWREPGSSEDTASKPKSDLTARHAQARSSIRRQPSVRIPNSASTSTRPFLLHRHLRSPPPQPPTRSVPPVPPLPRPAHADLSPRRRQPMPREPDSFWAPLHPLDHGSVSPIPDPLPSEYRPRSRRGTNTENTTDEMPPLRRMTHRSITDSPPPLLDGVDVLSIAPDHLHDPSAPVLGEAGDDADAHQWETLLTTITPDPSLPSASSSFTSAAAASFPRAPQGVVRPLRGRQRRGVQRGPVTVRAPPSPESSQSPPRAGADDFCPTDLDLDERDGSGALGSRPHDESTQTSTYRRLLDTAHAFHHSYEHLDFYFAEFVDAFSRRERTRSEAWEVLRAMEEMTVALGQAYERRQRTGGEASGRSSFRSLSENESPGGAALLPVTAQMMDSDSTTSRSLSQEERLRAVSNSVSEEELNELRELARGEDTPEMRSRGLRLSLRLLDSIGQVLLR